MFVAGADGMGLWDIGVILYFGIAVFAITMTYREQRQKGQNSPLFNVIGFAVCILWPLMIAAVLHSRTRSAT